MTDTPATTLPAFHLGRRALLLGAASAAVMGPVGRAAAQEADQGTPFSFEALIDRMREAAQSPYQEPQRLEGPAASLDYDLYRLIQFDVDKARWATPQSRVVLHAYHPGWLYDMPVALNEVVDGVSRPMTFDRSDFIYRSAAGDMFEDAGDFPGVAGFRLNAPLNTQAWFDEVVSFLGASYFRALGRGNIYGISARGLAVNTAVGGAEEFPRFTEFWLERPLPGSDHVVICAALDSPSVTGAFRFGITPGDTTKIDVDQRLFFRDAVRQVGIAPLTSMFLFAPNDPGDFLDYRARVHDSEMLIVHTGDAQYVRPLRNPATLANAYVGAENPTAFGLLQRSRDFNDYLDAEAAYERRPSLVVEPVGDWGRGAVRLIEIPTDTETNDNIVAFWVPEGDVEAGDSLSFTYRLHWGNDPIEGDPQRAAILRTLVGIGGVSGTTEGADRQKFVVDYDAANLTDLIDDQTVNVRATAINGEVVDSIVERLDRLGIWRLVLEVRSDEGAVTELRADLEHEDRRVTETWLYQWQTT